MIEGLLNRFQPDGEVLLQAISTHITDEMLACISRADYGCDADEHLSALRQLRDTGTLPRNPGWAPMEVLELIRWSEPDDPSWKPSGTGEFGHWMRAFSCAAILRAEHEPWNYHYNDDSTESTVIQLILSLDALPLSPVQPAAQHFAWLLLKSDPEGKNDSVRSLAVACFWFALQLDPRVPDDDLIELAQWTVKRADELKWDPRLSEFSGLRGMVIGCQKRSAWELFGLKLCELDLGIRSVDLQTWARLIGEQLVE